MPYNALALEAKEARKPAIIPQRSPASLRRSTFGCTRLPCRAVQRLGRLHTQKAGVSVPSRMLSVPLYYWRDSTEQGCSEADRAEKSADIRSTGALHSLFSNASTILGAFLSVLDDPGPTDSEHTEPVTAGSPSPLPLQTEPPPPEPVPTATQAPPPPPADSRRRRRRRRLGALGADWHMTSKLRMLLQSDGVYGVSEKRQALKARVLVSESRRLAPAPATATSTSVASAGEWGLKSRCGMGEVGVLWQRLHQAELCRRRSGRPYAACLLPAQQSSLQYVRRAQGTEATQVWQCN